MKKILLLIYNYLQILLRRLVENYYRIWRFFTIEFGGTFTEFGGKFLPSLAKISPKKCKIQICQYVKERVYGRAVIFQRPWGLLMC